MQNAPCDRRLLHVATAVFIGLGLVLGVAQFAVYFRAPLVEVGDAAVNALQANNARHFTELYGNYSRFEFNHPGPAFFYVYAAGEFLFHDLLHLTPFADGAHLLAGMLLQVLFFALALAILSDHIPWRAFVPASLVAAALYFGPLREPFVSIWPPHQLLMPSLCFLAACVSVACGRIGHLPVAVLAGGFLFHGHVAQVLFVVPLGGAAAWLCIKRMRAEAGGTPLRDIATRHRRTGAVCAGLIVVFLLPLCVDVVTRGRQSNVATIFGRFWANAGDTKTTMQALFYYVSFATASRDQADVFTRTGPQIYAFVAQHLWPIAAWGAVFLLSPVLAFAWRSRIPPTERRFFALAYGFLAAAVVLCVLWGKAQAGQMEHFNGYFYYAFYFFSLALLLGLLSRTVDKVWSQLITGSLCAIAAAIFVHSFHQIPMPHDRNGLPIRRGVESALSSDPDHGPKLLVFEQHSWPTVAGVALDLQRRGVMFYTEPWWSFMFGRRHQINDEDATPEDHADVWWIAKPGAGGTPISPDLSIFSAPAPIRPDGGEIRLRVNENGFRYVACGFGVGNADFASSDLPRAVLLFRPEKAQRDVRVVFDAQGISPGNGASPAQPADVFFDGQAVGRVAAGERSEVGVIVPASLWNSQPRGKIELRFPTAVASRSIGRPAYRSWAAWDIWRIRFEQAP